MLSVERLQHTTQKKPEIANTKQKKKYFSNLISKIRTKGGGFRQKGPQIRNQKVPIHGSVPFIRREVTGAGNGGGARPPDIARRRERRELLSLKNQKNKKREKKSENELIKAIYSQSETAAF